MRRMILVALICSACGKDAPGAPTPPPITPPAIQPITLALHVTATNGGQPLAGVSGDLGGVQAVTDTNGGVQYQMPPGASARLSLTGSGIVPRTLFVAATASRDVPVDAISVAGFDLNFYRQLVRNGLEEPTALQPLRRWTAAPRVYLKTVDETGKAIDARSLAAVSATITDSAPLWTGGRFGVAGIEQGAETRVGQAGWITVRWSVAPSPDHCGQSDVGLSGGAIDIYTNPRCSCGGVLTFPSLVRHELGHAFGYFHTDSRDDLMGTGTFRTCNQAASPRERLAASIAYARPVGNTDPDVDPAGAVSLAPMRVQ